MADPYFDNDDPSHDRMPMLWACLGIHAAIGILVFVAFYRAHLPLLDQLIHPSVNSSLMSMLIMTSASCIIGMVVSLAVTASTLKRSTAWFLGLVAAPLLLGLLAMIVLFSQ